MPYRLDTHAAYKDKRLDHDIRLSHLSKFLSEAEPVNINAQLL